jgi:hypothetical protein
MKKKEKESEDYTKQYWGKVGLAWPQGAWL